MTDHGLAVLAGEAAGAYDAIRGLPCDPKPWNASHSIFLEAYRTSYAAEALRRDEFISHAVAKGLMNPSRSMMEVRTVAQSRLSLVLSRIHHILGWRGPSCGFCGWRALWSVRGHAPGSSSHAYACSKHLEFYVRSSVWDYGTAEVERCEK